MLLPSALPCDRSGRGMVSPPASPPKLSTTVTFAAPPTSCFTLQSLMASAAAEHQAQQQQLDHGYNYNQQHDSHAQHHLQSYFGGALLPQPPPTPPTAHAPSPMKLRLRTNFREDGPRGIVKRTAPPRHKRTLSSESSSSSSSDREKTPEPPTTPKRSRIAPERMPLGLARADFHNLHEASTPPPFQDDSSAAEWTTEDDGILVELVLEKLKLSKADWQDCARSLGKDRHALARRWKSLVLNDDVGLKRRKVPSTWR
ncbi:MYB-like protein [Cordyceps fumosorosea ARSEF 2679]|uniref:MYB-like protein n=1 Tax=Cordyceps fumosorosea (strain ARSEF 2679) TaxID=1081104 RepID=A0A167WLT3_CORFA|nr:MYB-like protein [Cordyceps fumosorosea ARSEF 2679]OAA63949.1 MYB-like protein [Cordyceps fumosorosea ARSEF 2679]